IEVFNEFGQKGIHFGILRCATLEHFGLHGWVWPWPLYNLQEGSPRLGLPSRGDFRPCLGPFCRRGGSFKCCHSTDNSPFYQAYPATCSPNTASSLACSAAFLPGCPPPGVTYRTREFSSLAASNTSCSTRRSSGLSFCSWHRLPFFLVGWFFRTLLLM